MHSYLLLVAHCCLHCLRTVGKARVGRRVGWLLVKPLAKCSLAVAWRRRWYYWPKLNNCKPLQVTTIAIVFSCVATVTATGFGLGSLYSVSVHSAVCLSVSAACSTTSTCFVVCEANAKCECCKDFRSSKFSCSCSYCCCSVALSRAEHLALIKLKLQKG